MPQRPIFLVSGILMALAACSSPTPNRPPDASEAFPQVSGRSLEEQVVRVPEDFAGSCVVVLVGFVQDAQFDIDRWLLGLAQLETPVQIVELPTIEGMLPGLFAGRIADGMRSGIPREDWPMVVTLYGDDADRLIERFGNERPRSARVFVLDAEGRIVWFHDRGFGPRFVLEIDQLARRLAGRPSRSD